MELRSTYCCDEARFLRDVSEHEMTIIRDDGVSRHIRFRKPDTICMGFDLITWPGHLCYTGDMGTYVFQRLNDMFCFFREEPRHGNTGELYINTGYWSEKLEAVDKRGGVMEYSPDKFRETIKEILDEDEDTTDELRQAIEDEVLCYADDGGQEAYDAANSFQFDGKQYFTDFWEYDITAYTFRFVWCCYALSWAIRKYDQEKASQI